MAARPLVIVLFCAGCLILIQNIFPKVMALRNSPDVDEFMIEDQRTHRRQNYVVQRDLNDQLLSNIDNIGPVYNTETLESETNPEELPALIVDYANMIRNDIILLDNSVETRTRKRGNIKNNVLDPPSCSCGSIKEIINLGPNTYPQYVESINCSIGRCPSPNRCKETYYYVTVLKKRSSTIQRLLSPEEIPEELPHDLRHRWVAKKVNVTTGCVCTGENVDHKKIQD